MKQNQYFAILSLVLVLLAAGCRNPCKDLNCLNGGECVDGQCLCPDGFIGNTCQIEGVPCGSGYCYNGGTCTNGVCDCPPCFTGAACDQPNINLYIGLYNNSELCDGGNFTYQIGIEQTQLVGFDLVAYNLGGVGDFAGMDVEGCSFNIPIQNYGNGTISGAGTISNDGETVNLSYTFSFGGVSENCIATLSKL